MSEIRARKQLYRERMVEYLETYSKILFINVDNVGSSQLQKVRMTLRGKAVIMMGKNTMMRAVVRDLVLKGGNYACLLPLLKGNTGFCFTNEDLKEIREAIVSEVVPAGARTGAFAPKDVWIPRGPTGLDPGNTQFFQALNIATKIARGAIEIVSDVHLIKVNERITSSAVALLTKLNIRPFFFGIKVTDVYEQGCVYDVKVLDLTHNDMMNKFWSGVNMVAAVSLAVGYPTLASMPHSFSNAFKQLVAVAVETGYAFPEAQPFLDYLADPSAFAAAAPTSTATATAAAPAPEPEEEEEEEEVEGFSLFD